MVSDSSDLESHNLTDSSDCPFSCKVCNKKFTKSCDLKCHMRIHTGERPFSCKVCNKKFTQSFKLNRHTLVHSGEHPLSCSVLQSLYTQFHKLSFLCELCDYMFTSSTLLKFHTFTYRQFIMCKFVTRICRTWLNWMFMMTFVLFSWQLCDVYISAVLYINLYLFSELLLVFYCWSL